MGLVFRKRWVGVFVIFFLLLSCFEDRGGWWLNINSVVRKGRRYVNVGGYYFCGERCFRGRSLGFLIWKKFMILIVGCTCSFSCDSEVVLCGEFWGGYVVFMLLWLFGFLWLWFRMGLVFLCLLRVCKFFFVWFLRGFEENRDKWIFSWRSCCY